MCILIYIEIVIVNDFESMKDKMESFTLNMGMLLFPDYIEEWKFLL